MGGELFCIDDILQKYSTMVYRIAYARTKNSADADDVMQDVFMRYIRENKPFIDEEHIKAWLIRVTVNVSKNLLASAWFRKTAPLEENIPVEMESASPVLAEVLRLPAKYRTVVHLFYLEDMSVLQISRALGARESTVKSWLLRARELLRKQLKGEYGDV